MQSVKRSRFGTNVKSVIVALGALGSLSQTSAVSASEGGADYYVPGVYGNFAMATLPESGTYYLNYLIYQSGELDEPVVKSGEVHAGMSTDLVANAAALVVISDHKILGGRYVGGAALVLGGLEVRAGVVNVPGLQAQDTNWGMADPTLVPAGISWMGLGANENWDFFLFDQINVPVGEYDDDNLSNLGLGYWANDLNLSTTYRMNDKVWFDANIGWLYNWENDDTDYQTGSSVHVDWTVEYHLSERFQIGLQGYYYTQIEGDSGSGATLGNFKGEAWGIGPSFQIVFNRLPAAVLNFSWIHDISTTNRLEYDTATLFFALQF